MTNVLKKARGLMEPLLPVLAALAAFIILDTLLAAWAPAESLPYFPKNDYEKVVLSHGGVTEYDKVIFGNSTLISSYIEEQSRSGYVNFGLDYGTVSDLYGMLTKGYLSVKSELVIDLNYFVLMDTLDTNPTYPWHRGALEPYVFFQRDRLSPALTAAFTNLLHFRDPLALPQYPDLNRTVYHGVMTDQELAEKIAAHKALFWGLGPDSYKKNLDDLGAVAKWCADNGVRLRVFWGPWNNDVEMPENPARITAAANAVLAEYGIAAEDMTGCLARKYFYDIGHLNYEYGAVYFTEALDKWLLF